MVNAQAKIGTVYNCIDSNNLEIASVCAIKEKKAFDVCYFHVDDAKKVVKTDKKCRLKAKWNQNFR